MFYETSFRKRFLFWKYGVFKVVIKEKWIYWRAVTRKDGKLKRIGQYKTEWEAATAYDIFIIETFILLIAEFAFPI